MIILLDVGGQKCKSHMGVCTETIVIFAFAFYVVAFTSSSMVSQSEICSEKHWMEKFILIYNLHTFGPDSWNCLIFNNSNENYVGFAVITTSNVCVILKYQSCAYRLV